MKEKKGPAAQGFSTTSSLVLEPLLEITLLSCNSFSFSRLQGVRLLCTYAKLLYHPQSAKIPCLKTPSNESYHGTDTQQTGCLSLWEAKPRAVVKIALSQF